MDDFRLSTIDNPFDPFTQFNSWFLFDVEKGYDSCSIIARISDQFPNFTSEEVLDFIVKHDLTNVFIKVKRGDNDTRIRNQDKQTKVN